MQLHDIVGTSKQYEQAKCSCGEWMDFQDVAEHLAVNNAIVETTNKSIAEQTGESEKIKNIDEEWDNC